MSISGGGQTHNPNRPEFIRLPRNGSKCPLTGLGRSSLNSLVLPCESNNHKPPVKSIVLRKRGNARGARLIVVDSLLDYLYRQGDEATEGEEKL